MGSAKQTTIAPARCASCGRPAGTASLASCPACGGPIVVGAGASKPAAVAALFSLPPVQHPNQYIWFVLVSSLDLMLTCVILNLGGAEVNAVANAVLSYGGLPTLVMFKFALVTLVIVFCEWITRRNPRAGFKLAEWAVAITAIPVAISLIQLAT